MSDNPNVAAALCELRSMVLDADAMGMRGRSRSLRAAINALEAQASAPGIDDDTAAYVDPDTRSIHIDWDADPANQLSLIVKRDGSVAFAAYHHGQKTVGNAMGPEFKQAMRLWASAPGGMGDAVTEEMVEAAREAFWREFPMDERDAEWYAWANGQIREMLTAALAARTNKEQQE